MPTLLQRVHEGGHDVPSDKIKDRYYRSLELLHNLIKISDEIKIYDNSLSSDKSESAYRLVYKHDPESFYFNDAFKNEEWVNKYIIPYVQY